jgi:hypothetical protein
VKRTQDNHAYGADDTAIIAAVPYGAADHGEHSPMAGHGLLASPDPGDEGRDDGLATELAKSAPRVWWNRGTLVLGGVALILAGLLGGIQVQKHYGTATTAAGAGAARGAFGGAGRGAGAYGGANGFPGAGANGPSGAATAPAAASGTTGTVKLVDGDTIYVQTADGTVVTVKTSGNTSVKTATKGTLKDVKAGASITVQGAAGSDGTVTATSVTTDKK